ncbi:MAG: helix-turn-helix domain-containing protein [Rudaea sp.]
MTSRANTGKRDSGPHRVKSGHRTQSAGQERIPICVIVTDNVLLLDVAGIVEPFRIANWWSAKENLTPRFDLRFFGARSTERCSLGLSLSRLEPLPKRLPDGAWLIVPGIADVSTTLPRLAQSSVVGWLANVGALAARKLTVCSGALLAAHAGWLDGRACTTHHGLIGTLRSIAPRAKVLENRIFVVDDSLATSAGITAGIDLALWAVGEVLGPAGALGVAREMVVHARREGGDPQISSWLQQRNHLHPAVHRVQDAIAQAPSQSWTLASMATIACVGERQLTRLFKHYAGSSPSDYLHRVRLEAFDELIVDERRSIESAATAVGYSSAQQLRRVWRRQREGSPRR